MIEHDIDVFDYHTLSASVEDFGGYVSRFVDFHMDNLNVLLDVISCHEFPDVDVVNRVVSFMQIVWDMDGSVVTEMCGYLRSHDFTLVNLSRGSASRKMFMSLSPVEGSNSPVQDFNVLVDWGSLESSGLLTSVLVNFDRDRISESDVFYAEARYRNAKPQKLWWNNSFGSGSKTAD